MNPVRFRAVGYWDVIATVLSPGAMVLVWRVGGFHPLTHSPSGEWLKHPYTTPSKAEWDRHQQVDPGWDEACRESSVVPASERCVNTRFLEADDSVRLSKDQARTKPSGVKATRFVRGSCAPHNQPCAWRR